MADGPPIQYWRLVLWFGCEDFSISDVFVKDEALNSISLPVVAGVPDVEVSTSVRGDKLMVAARDPLDTCHSSVIY